MVTETEKKITHNVRLGLIILVSTLAIGKVGSSIMHSLWPHAATAMFYALIVGYCSGELFSMLADKYSWLRMYVPQKPVNDPNDPKRINFTSIQTVSRAHRPGRSSEHIFPTVVVDYDWFAMQQERREEQERLQKELFGGWPDRHPIHSYATIPYTAALCQQIEELGYADEVVKELETQPCRIHEDLLIDIFRDLIFQLRTRPREKVIFKPLSETHS